MRRRAAGSVRAALGPGAASIVYASCGEEVAASESSAVAPVACAVVTGLLSRFALLVPMRALSHALRQWFAAQSKCLHQRCCQLQLN